MNTIEKIGLILFIAISSVGANIVYPLEIFDWFIIALSVISIVLFMFGKGIENASTGWKIMRRYEIYEVEGAE